MTSCKSSDFFIARAKLPRQQMTSKQWQREVGLKTIIDDKDAKAIKNVIGAARRHTHENVLVCKSTNKVD